MRLRLVGLYRRGRRVLLHLMAGSKEDAETAAAFLEDMKTRGLSDPQISGSSNTSLLPKVSVSL